MEIEKLTFGLNKLGYFAETMKEKRNKINQSDNSATTASVAQAASASRLTMSRPESVPLLFPKDLVVRHQIGSPTFQIKLSAERAARPHSFGSDDHRSMDGAKYFFRPMPNLRLTRQVLSDEYLWGSSAQGEGNDCLESLKAQLVQWFKAHIAAGEVGPNDAKVVVRFGDIPYPCSNIFDQWLYYKLSTQGDSPPNHSLVVCLCPKDEPETRLFEFATPLGMKKDKGETQKQTFTAMAVRHMKYTHPAWFPVRRAMMKSKANPSLANLVRVVQEIAPHLIDTFTVWYHFNAVY